MSDVDREVVYREVVYREVLYWEVVYGYGRTAMDMAVLCCQAVIFLVVALYAPWLEVRQNSRDISRLGAPFALGILGRLMTSVLATSGVVFNITCST